MNFQWRIRLRQLSLPIFSLLITGMLLSSCYGPVWPSRGMTVALSHTGASADEVGGLVVAELRKRGFTDIGKDGREAIRKERTAIYLQGQNDLKVIVQLDLPNEVPIR